jgi:hypothetical protein
LPTGDLPSRLQEQCCPVSFFISHRWLGQEGRGPSSSPALHTLSRQSQTREGDAAGMLSVWVRCGSGSGFPRPGRCARAITNCRQSGPSGKDSSPSTSPRHQQSGCRIGARATRASGGPSFLPVPRPGAGAPIGGGKGWDGGHDWRPRDMEAVDGAVPIRAPQFGVAGKIRRPAEAEMPASAREGTFNSSRPIGTEPIGSIPWSSPATALAAQPA